MNNAKGYTCTCRRVYIPESDDSVVKIIDSDSEDISRAVPTLLTVSKHTQYRVPPPPPPP